MNEIYVEDLYQVLLVDLNGLIEKTVEIQKATPYNSYEYREALKFQIEFEKTKLQIMESLGEGLEVNISNKVLTGYDDVNREIFEIKNSGDVRFIGKLTDCNTNS